MTSQQIAVRSEETGLTKAGLDHTREQLSLLENFVKDVLRPGQDYGVIPGTNGKPTLLKPGAANVTAAFNCHAEPTIDSSVLSPDSSLYPGGFVSYEAHVDLVSNLTGLVMARGFGNCNSYEAKYRYRWQGRGEERVRIINEDPLEQANTIKKMAIKRAEVDAAMRLPGVARFFTQDLEDMEAGSIATEKAALKDNRYWCAEHKTEWFKKGKMTGYAHPIGDTGKWCRMADARLDAKDNRDQPQEPAPEAQGARSMPTARDMREVSDAITAASELPARHTGKDITASEWRGFYDWVAERYGIEGPEGIHLILGKSAAEWTGTLREAAALIVAAKEEAAKG